MKIGLFIPCYIDQLYPRVGIATVAVLEKLALDFDFPQEQSCCGQPMSNSGCSKDAAALAERFLKTFAPYDCVLSPSASCVGMVRFGYEEHLSGKAGFKELKAKTFELCEFLVDVHKKPLPAGHFPHKVGLHQSCHGLREMALAAPSERIQLNIPNKVRQALAHIKGLELLSPARTDECCGFGGTFSTDQPEISCAMGRQRIEEHLANNVDFMTATDMSCLMHMDGLIRRDKNPLKVLHVAELLAKAWA